MDFTQESESSNKISLNGPTLTLVFDSGGSDHSLVYAVRRAHYIRGETKMIEVRNTRNFNGEKFTNDLNHQT